DNADPGLESCAKSVYYPVRRPDAEAVMKFRLHKIRDTLTPEVIPGTLPPEERLARFIYHKNDWSKQVPLRPKPKVFLPEKYEGKWETSVCRISFIPEQRIWEIAHRARAPRPALARADIVCGSVEDAGLQTIAAPDHENDYPEHAVIVGWPDDKGKQMLLAIQLIPMACPRFDGHRVKLTEPVSRIQSG
ncbi:MAG: hypothetical protein WBW94_07430, partial [Anaerolineales bacterium]